jgi:hypothetical protein
LVVLQIVVKAAAKTTMIDAIPLKKLHRLIYHSRFSPSFPKTAADQDHEIGVIIRASIRNNRIASITGMLLVRGDQFLQVLEGPAASVRVTYSRILADRRHIAAKLIHQGVADQRAFGDCRTGNCRTRSGRADGSCHASGCSLAEGDAEP